MSSITRKPADIDWHVATQITKRRRSLGITQQELAGKLGVTFQQVQKYERGKNRVSAARLFQISEALGVPVTYFFPDPKAAASPSGKLDPETTRDLAEFYLRYSTMNVRLRELIRKLVFEIAERS